VFKEFLDKFKVASLFQEQRVITTVSGKKVVINQ
jgi:hypothetical protein